jgi:thiol-disulfide isomerase/thioredoxin
MGNWVSEWQGTVGWVYFNEGKLDEAQEKLEASLTLREKSAENTIRLGRVYEAKGKTERAEQFYTDALSMFSSEEEHPAVKALRESYVRRHGNSEGLDAYMKPILVKDQERRKAEVLRARISSPGSIPAFSLTSLDGKTVTSEGLKGKILVINFWATWCGPCRRELPDYDKFYQKYKDDPNVVVLTVATDDADTPQESIQDFVSKHKYTFPVLLAPEWAKQNLIRPIPMTWFVDRNGNKVFQKIGYTKELMQEFDWRIKAMQKGGTTQSEKSAAAKSE